MTFEEWWYDWRIKNNIGDTKQREEIARAAWNAAAEECLRIAKNTPL